MKKRLLLLTVLVVSFVMLLAVSASASIKKFPTDEFQTGDNITYLDGINTSAYLGGERTKDITTLIDNDKYFSRVVMQNSDGTYTTYPAWYVLNLVYDWQGSYQYSTMDRLNALSEVTGETYEIADIIRFEYPEFTSTAITNKDARAGTATPAYFPNARYIRIPTHFTGVSFFNGNNVEIIDIPAECKIVTVGKASILNCYKLEKLILPNTVTTIAGEGINFYSKQSTSALKELRLGASLTTLGAKNAIGNCSVPDIKVYVPETLDGATYDASYFPSTATIIFTGTKKQAEAFGFTKVISAEEYALAGSPAEAGTIVYGYNKCDAFYGGKHSVEASDCTVGGTCTRCGKGVKEEKHALVHTLSYANGFDKTGVYNYYCENEGCTIADKAVRDAEKGAIITFKGYSTPETGNVKGINAGFKVEKVLLTLYNDLNEVDATLTIFMVNSKSDDVNISKILDGDTLELADGVKGINVKITSLNYTSISVEVRGFDDSEGGSFYTLNLITAIAVKTADGVHYVQAGLKNSPNTTQTVDGVDFNIVTANKIYNPAS